MSLCDGDIHYSSVWSLCNGCTGHGIVGVSSSFPLSTRGQSVSLDQSSSVLLLAGLLSVSFFYLLPVRLHGLGSQTLFATSKSCVAFIPVKPSSFWSFRWIVCTGLSRKGSIDHLLILMCLRVEWGLCLEHFTQSVIEIGGSLICFFGLSL